MGVGDSLDVVYALPGPVPAGDYVVDAYGYQQTNGAQIHFDLIWRPMGGSDQVLASADGARSQSDDGGVPRGRYGAQFHADAIPAKCDDLLVLRIKMVSGASPFLEIFSDMEIP